MHACAGTHIHIHTHTHTQREREREREREKMTLWVKAFCAKIDNFQCTVKPL